MVPLTARGVDDGASRSQRSGASRRQRSDGRQHVSDPMAVAAESHLGVATVDGRDGDRGRPRKRRQYWSKHERMTMKIDEKKSIQSRGDHSVSHVSAPWKKNPLDFDSTSCYE
jgi:hypothetical protein